MSQITARANCHAKINLGLQIGDLQSNGLHQINTEIIKIELCDTLILTADTAKNNGEIKLTITNETDGDFQVDADNLIIRSTRLFFTSKHPNLHWHLIKRIPVGAGLGGGSSDAATVLRMLEQVFPKQPVKLDLLASKLGSDVLAMLDIHQHLRVAGTGEVITPLPNLNFKHIVLIRPRGLQIATAEMFKQWDEIISPLLAEETKRSINNNDINNKNDFQELVFNKYPEIKTAAKLLTKLKPKYLALSGSGSVVFAIFKDKPDISQIDNQQYWTWQN